MQTRLDPNKKRNVVLVEDSPTQATRLQVILQQYGLNVIVAVDGEQGLSVTRHVHPDVVILDIEMPKMNGIQVCQSLKSAKETRDIPVIILTRHDESEEKVRGLESGAIEYISKDPFASAVLIETLRQMGVITKEE